MATKKSASSKSFGLIFGALALAGVAALGFVLSRPTKVITLDSSLPPVAAAGILRGNPDAPVQVVEFADFECPACAGFATITEPDVRTRIIDRGLASITYYDFPLTMHPNTMPASHAAACADEQGKFWSMHDRIFQGQDEWNGQATDSPKEFFKRYANEVGLDIGRWEACYDSKKYERRINANLADGLRRGVGSTPSFVIGNKLYPGSMTYDEMKAIVDANIRNAPPAAASGTPAAR